MMKKCSFTAVAALLAAAPFHAVLAGHHEVAAGHHPVPAEPLRIGVIDAAGEAIGTAVIEQTPGGVLISVEIAGLPAGGRGFHIHEKGRCDPAEGFTTAGGHFDPGGHHHGLKTAQGAHAGDMPNQFAGADGVMRAEVLNPNVTLGEGGHSLADADGSALIVHEGPDDYTTQPTGAAGGRLACAVIVPPKEM